MKRKVGHLIKVNDHDIRRIQFDRDTDYMVRDALNELLEYRAMDRRLEDWAHELEVDRHGNGPGRTGVGYAIATELRRRMKGEP